MAGLTVAVILLPQAIAFALIAELPPQMGLYAAVIGGIVGALWGSSNQIHNGPTNAISLLVLSTLSSTAIPGTAGIHYSRQRVGFNGWHLSIVFRTGPPRRIGKFCLLFRDCRLCQRCRCSHLFKQNWSIIWPECFRREHIMNSTLGDAP